MKKSVQVMSMFKRNLLFFRPFSLICSILHLSAIEFQNFRGKCVHHVKGHRDREAQKIPELTVIWSKWEIGLNFLWPVEFCLCRVPSGNFTLLSRPFPLYQVPCFFFILAYLLFSCNLRVSMYIHNLLPLEFL